MFCKIDTCFVKFQDRLRFGDGWGENFTEFPENFSGKSAIVAGENISVKSEGSSVNNTSGIQKILENFRKSIRKTGNLNRSGGHTSRS